jgi:hypothetical protein
VSGAESLEHNENRAEEEYLYRYFTERSKPEKLIK